MNFIKKNLYKFVSIVFVFSFPVISVLADNFTSCEPGKLCNPINAGSVSEIIKDILEGALKIGIPIIALAIIYCGFLFVFALGNSEKLKKAKDALLYTLIGAAVLLGAWAIAQLISETVLAL